MQPTKTSLRKLLDIKNKRCKCYLGNKGLKIMFLVVSRSNVQFGFEHQSFLRARSGAKVKLCAREIGRLKRNLLTPETQ